MRAVRPNQTCHQSDVTHNHQSLDGRQASWSLDILGGESAFEAEFTQHFRTISAALKSNTKYCRQKTIKVSESVYWWFRIVAFFHFHLINYFSLVKCISKISTCVKCWNAHEYYSIDITLHMPDSRVIISKLKNMQRIYMYNNIHV